MDKNGSRFISDEETLNDTQIEVETTEEPIAEEQSNTDIDEASDKDEELKRDKEKDERLKDKNTKKLEKHMKKTRRRENRSDRKVLSYEDLPLEKGREERKKTGFKFKKKRIVVASIIVVVLLVIVFIFANSDRLSLHNISNFIQYGVFNKDSDQRFPIGVLGENISVGNFSRMGQDLCYASDTKLQTVNNYGKPMLTSQLSYANPVLATSDKYSLVYHLGGTGFQINSIDNTIYTGESDDKIFVADIIDSGTYALVTQSDGYLSKLKVYDRDNNQIFAYSFADFYITSVALHPGGRSAVLSGLSALDGSEMTALYVLDFTNDTPTFIKELNENVVYQVDFLNDTFAAAVGNTACHVINIRSGEVTSTDYEGKTLTAYTFNPGTSTFTVSLSRSGDGRNCEIISFNSNGTIAKSFITDLKVQCISTYKNRVALLTSDCLYLYNKDGGYISKNNFFVDPHAVVLYTSADAYVLDTSEIRSVSM